MLSVTTLLIGVTSVGGAWAGGSGPVVTSPGAQNSPTGVILSLPMSATQGTAPLAWSASGLPTGLAIDPATGLISGTPSTAGTFASTVTATDAHGSAGSASFSWTTGVVVTNPGTRGTALGVAVSLPVAAAGGTAPYTWSATGLPTGLAVAPTGVVTGTPSAAGTWSVVLTATDASAVVGSASFTWNVGPAPKVTDPGTQASPSRVALSLTATATGGTAPYTWSATGLPAGLTVNASTGVVSGTPTAAGTSTVVLTATDALGIAGGATFTWTTGVIVANPGTRASLAGVPVNYADSAAGGTAPYSWSATGLPAGVGIDAHTGAITGAPGAAGSSTVELTATDTAGVAGRTTFTWNVGNPPAVADPGAQASQTGDRVSLPLTVSGGTAPFTWSATGLPAGLTINPSTGVVTGAPTAAGSYPVKVTATGTDGVAGTVSFTWTVTAVLAVVDPGAQAGTVAVSASLALTAVGGVAPYTWSATGLPDGLGLDRQTGTVSGAPTAAGPASVTVVGTDAAGHTATVTFTWTVYAVAAPYGLTVAANDAQMVNVSWGGVPGAAGYEVYRDGALITRTGSWPAFFDSQLNGGTTYRYQLKAFDGSGNESPLGDPVAVTTAAAPAAPFDYARCGSATGAGCTYTASVAAEAATPDVGGTSLTDGVHAPAALGPGWQARDNVWVYSFVVDLGAPRAITEMNTNWLQVKNQWVFLPPSVTYSTSLDGTNFDTVAYIPRPAMSDADQTRTLRAIGLNVTARYVKVSLDGTGGTTAIDEFEVRGVTPVNPPAPQGLAARADGVQGVNLSWWNVPGAAGYEVYRDGALITRTGTWPAFFDTQLDGDTSYRYQLKTVDGTGNESPLGDPVTVTTGAAPAAPIDYGRCGVPSGQPGCAYTASVAPDTATPDVGGKSLTDGLHGPTALGPRWQARDNVWVYSFVMDLGAPRPITEINTTWLQQKSQWVVLPPSVTYSTSTDGTNFQTVAYIPRPPTSDADQTKAYRAIGLNVTARYVKVSLDGTGGTTAIDEFEVRGVTPVGPSTPQGLVAWNDGVAWAGLVWQPVAGAVGYEVYRDGVLVARTGALPMFLDGTIGKGTTYRYQVKAVDAAGNRSGLSDAVTVTTPGKAVPPGQAKKQ